MLFVVWGHLGKWMGGIDLVHMRLLHALVGLLTIVASYYLFRQLLPRGWAMFASSVFGLNHAYLLISRLAMRENTAVAAEVVALGLLLRGFRQRHLFSTFLGGIAAGLGFYVYHPGRAAFVLWAVFLGLLALFYRPMFPLRRIATFGAAAFAGLVLVTGPLLISEAKAPPTGREVDPMAQLLITQKGRDLQRDWVGANSTPRRVQAERRVRPEDVQQQGRRSRLDLRESRARVRRPPHRHSRLDRSRGTWGSG